MNQMQFFEKSYAVLKSVIESPKNVNIFALDCEYRYITFNRRHSETMKQIWGADIVIGNSMLGYIPNPEDRLKAKRNFDQALSGESFTLEEEYGDTELERRYYENNYNPILDENGVVLGLSLFLTDITDKKKTETERNKLLVELQSSISKVKMLSGLLPVCSSCKKIRTDEGDWEVIEAYIKKHSEADFTHSICPDCVKKLYPDLSNKISTKSTR